jgi:hypothetical protein
MADMQPLTVELWGIFARSNAFLFVLTYGPWGMIGVIELPKFENFVVVRGRLTNRGALV